MEVDQHHRITEISDDGVTVGGSVDGLITFAPVRDAENIVVDFEWVAINAAAAQMIGRPAAYLVGRGLLASIHTGVDRWKFDRYVEVMETGRPYTGDHRLERDGESTWFSTTAVKVGDTLSVTYRLRPSELSEANDEESDDETFLSDSLTGLPTRVLFENRVGHAIERLWRRPVSLAVLFVDLDRFHVINDSLGHVGGDILLCEVAHRLQTVARPADTVARFGGDEFVVLCEDLAYRHEADRIARRFLDVLGEPFHLEGREVHVSASIGAVIADSVDLVDTGSLLRDADAALHQAKAAGGNRVQFVDSALHAEMMARLDVEVELRHGIGAGELEVFYQPIVRTADTDRLVAVEALVRWRHPRNGLVLPGAFIPVAEETGLIIALGAQVLHEALRQLAIWQREVPANAPEYVTVNVAAAQLGMDEMADNILDAIAEVGLSPGSLCVEVTETSFLRDPITAKIILDTLSAAGVKIALDDFGTGYSSLSHLRVFPVDIIKIDQSFIETVATSINDQGLGEALVVFAASLDKTVVAEGVETLEQLDVLDRLGVQLVQGNHISPAVPAGELTALLRGTRQPTASSLFEAVSGVPGSDRLDQPALASVSDAVAAAGVVCEYLFRRWGVLPSVYFERDGLLRCVAQRGYWQVLDGIPRGVGVLSNAVVVEQRAWEVDIDHVDDFLEAAPGLVAEIAVPIRVAHQVAGGLNIESTHPIGTDMADDADRCARLLGDRLDEIGVGGSHTALARFARSSKKLAGLAEPDDVRRAVVAMACDIAAMDSALLTERGPDGTPTVIATSGPMSDGFEAIPLMELECLASLVSRVSSCYSAGDLSGRAVPGTETLRAVGAVEIVVVPVGSIEGHDGVLVVTNTTERRLTTDDVEPLELLGIEAGRCLDLAATVDELRWRARRDPLTELENHSAFYDALDTTVRPFALAMMDLDRFKAVNDRDGHLAGDQALRNVASVLRQTVGDLGLSYRVGGDEFAIILPHTAIDDAMNVARRVRDGICDALEPVDAAVSIGVTVATRDEHCHQAAKRADDLLYQAKRDRIGGIRHN